MTAAEIQAGRRYIINTNSGRKLIWVLEVRREINDARIQRLRATARKMTQPEIVTLAWLLAQGIRKPGDADRDLLRLATTAAYGWVNA